MTLGPGRTLAVTHIPANLRPSSVRPASHQSAGSLPSLRGHPERSAAGRREANRLTTPSTVNLTDSSDSETEGGGGQSLVVEAEVMGGRKPSLPPLREAAASPGLADSSGSQAKRVRWLLKPLADGQLLTPAAANGPEVLSNGGTPVEEINPEPVDEAVQGTSERRGSSSYGQRPVSVRSTLGESSADAIPPAEHLIFFIHGVGGTSTSWRHQIRHFSRLGYEIVALDLVGHGSSSRPRGRANYAFTTIAADVLRVFDRFAKPSNVVIAHSYGTCFAVVLGRERAVKVSHLVLLSPGSSEALDPTLGFPSVFIVLLAPLIRFNFKRRAYARGKPQEGLGSASVVES